MTVAFGLFILFVGGATMAWLVYKGYSDKDAAMGWIGAILCIISSLMIFVGYTGEHSITPTMPSDARQTATFIIIVAMLCAVAGVVVWRMRKRPQTAPGAAGGTVHAYGSYTPADIHAARVMAQRARQGVRNG
jgi:protein-S-isoprenylcysteine O-methyltransferase Ste14